VAAYTGHHREVIVSTRACCLMLWGIAALVDGDSMGESLSIVDTFSVPIDDRVCRSLASNHLKLMSELDQLLILIIYYF